MLAKLEQSRKDLALEEEKLADLPKAIEDQRTKLKACLCQASSKHKAIKPIPRSDAEDMRIIEEVDQIRLRAISVIQKFLG